MNIRKLCKVADSLQVLKSDAIDGVEYENQLIYSYEGEAPKINYGVWAANDGVLYLTTGEATDLDLGAVWLDTNGNLRFWINPNNNEEVVAAADELANFFEVDRDSILSFLSNNKIQSEVDTKLTKILEDSKNEQP